jgi:hypothetical protein
MPKVLRLRSAAAVIMIPWIGGTSALVTPAATCRADVAPESGLLAHVQPVSADGCATTIVDCHDIDRSTSENGLQEFVLFFMRGSYSWPGEALCIESLHSELTWPDAWRLVDFHACGGWPDATLDTAHSPHNLDISWAYLPYAISDEPGGVVPVARLVMEVVGQGTLGFRPFHGEAGLRRDCYGSLFMTYPAEVGAEAGMGCGTVAAHCGYREDGCLASFDEAALDLSAWTGEAAQDSVGFHAHDMIDHLCPLSIDTHASWCTAWIEPVHWDTARLHVTADAAGLSPSVYETDIELYNVGWGVSRCLPVTFTVVEVPAGVEEPSSPAIRAVRWGSIKALYR